MNNEQLEQFAENTNKKLGLITTIINLHTAKIRTLTDANKPKQASEKPSVVSTEDSVIKSVSTSLGIIAAALKRVNTSLSKMSAVGVGAVPTAMPTPAASTRTKDKEEKEKEGGGFSSLLKDLFTNPAVIAAFSGLAYFFLPKEVQKELKDFFTSFGSGLDSAVGKAEGEGFTGFGNTIKVAGMAIATVFGAKLLSSLASATITTVKIIKLMGAGGKIGKLGIAGGVIAGGAMYMGARALTDDEEKDTTTTPSPTPATNAPEEKPPVGGLKSTGSVGIKPGGGYGIKAPPPADIKDIIVKASKKVGVDESTMIAVARQESGFNPSAKAGTSSAKGLYQFVDATWNDMLRKYGNQYPELSKGPMDPLASAIAGALYIKENSKVLEKAGIPVNATNLYALHFLGAGGGPKLLKSDPTAIAADILPSAAGSNKNVFYNKDGSPKTVGEVIEFLYGKVGSYASAYASGDMQPPTVADITSRPVKTATTGQDVNNASMNMRVLTTGATTQNQVASIDNSSTRSTGTEKTRSSAPIPSPIANRGSLNGYVKHSTSYA
jgi:hypothetical protein